MIGLNSFFAALAFYTNLPIPVLWASDFQRVACLAPVVGVVIGGLLALLDWGLVWLNMPVFSRSATEVAVWIALTGGLHLDGAIDAADGLAVPDAKRRLEVMTESTTGAFGVMAAVLLVLLKTAALTDLVEFRWLILPVAAGWGRWGQQVAIARYPYLKPTGKGAFHKAAIRSFWDTVPALLLLLGLSAFPLGMAGRLWFLSLGLVTGGIITFLVAAWFNRKLGGHTGDTYGAVVEWTEALFLVCLTLTQGLRQF